MGLRHNCLPLSALACLSAALAQTPASLRSGAEKAEKSGDVVNAYLLYSQAAALDPGDRTLWAKSTSLRSRAMIASNFKPPGPPAVPMLQIEERDPVTREELETAKVLRPPPRLQPRPGTQTFDLRGDSRQIMEAVLRAFGVEPIFEADFQPLSNLKLRLAPAGFQEAQIAATAATGTFLVPVSDRMALVARDTQQKRQEFEHTIAVAIPLPTPVTVQEAQELARAVQQLMEIQRFGIDSAQRMVLIKDRVSKVMPALALFQDLLRFKAEVHIEVELIEVAENSSLDLGLKLPTLFPIRSVSEITGTRVTIPALLRNLANFSPAKFFAVAIADSQLFASMSQSSSRTLSRAELRSTEGQAVSFHVGDRYPILTAGYFGDTSGGEAFRPPPTFNFEDLGLVLKITPRVHGLDEVGMDVEAEYKVLTGQALNGIPVIANRKFTSRVRTKDSEIALVTGLVRASEARSITGMAGLAQIPVLGAAFRQDSRSKEQGQTLFVIRPRIVRAAASEEPVKTIWTGPEARPRIPL